MFFGRKRIRSATTGQALVEFALVLLILLLIIFVLIEAARILFTYATLQNAVRTGARYGITGQYDETISVTSTEDPRVQSIKDRVLQSAGALIIESEAVSQEPYYFDVQVWGADGSGGPLIQDFAGVSRWPLRVQARYRLPMVTPLTSAIARSVMINAEVVMNNESFDQIAGSRLSGGAIAPPMPSQSAANLAVHVTDSHDPVSVGQEFDYVVEAQNNGPLLATNVTITSTLDVPFTFVHAQPSSACNLDAGRLVCTLARLPNGATETLTIRVRSDAAQIMTNTVHITGDQLDPFATDNIDQEQTTVE